MQDIITKAEMREVERNLRAANKAMHPIMTQYHMLAERYWQKREQMIEAAENLSGLAREIAYQLNENDTAQQLRNLAPYGAKVQTLQAELWHIAAAALEFRESCKVLGLIADA